MHLRLAFFGSPAFAVPSLEALASRHTVALVVTQPERPVGRGLRLEPTAVQQASQAHGLPFCTYDPLDSPRAGHALEASWQTHLGQALFD